MFDRGYDREQIRQLLRLTDWLMALPRDLQQSFQQRFREYQEENQMPFVSFFEEYAAELAAEQGVVQEARRSLLTVLEARFGEIPEALRDRLSALNDTNRLRQLLQQAAVSASLAECERGM